MKVSFIIPVYNCEKYVAECIESVLANRCDFYEQEIVLIDDGSKDSSGAICDRYAAGHPEIKVIHQVNQGVSVARNAGLDVATGEWVMFIDADDILRRDALLLLYENAEFYKYEVVKFGSFVFDQNGFLYKQKRKYSTERLEYLELLYCRKAIMSVWAGIYSRAFLEQYSFRFIPKIRIGEDWIVSYKIVYYAQRFKYIDQAIYGWRKNEKSVTRSKCMEVRPDVLIAYKTILDFNNQNKVYVNKGAFHTTLSNLRCGYMRKAVRSCQKHIFQETDKLLNVYVPQSFWNDLLFSSGWKDRAGLLLYTLLSKMIYIF